MKVFYGMLGLIASIFIVGLLFNHVSPWAALVFVVAENWFVIRKLEKGFKKK